MIRDLRLPPRTDQHKPRLDDAQRAHRAARRLTAWLQRRKRRPVKTRRSTPGAQL